MHVDHRRLTEEIKREWSLQPTNTCPTRAQPLEPPPLPLVTAKPKLGKYCRCLPLELTRFYVESKRIS